MEHYCEKTSTIMVAMVTTPPITHMMTDSLSNGSVLHVKMWLFGVDDKELGSIGVRSTVGHGDHTTSVVLWGEGRKRGRWLENK